MTRLRMTAGACMLSAGLLVASAGGAVAFADDDTADTNTSTTTQTQSSDDTTAATAATGSDALGAADVTAAEEPAGTTASSVVPGPAAKPFRFGDRFRQAVENFRVDVSSALEKLSQHRLTVVAVGQPDADASLAPGTTHTNATQPTVAGSEPAVSSTSTAPVSPRRDVDSLAAVVDPVADALVDVVKVAGGMPALLAALPDSKTPITDVITAIEQMLTTVSDAVVAIAHVPADLSSLLGVTMADAPPAPSVAVNHLRQPVVADPAPLFVPAPPPASAPLIAAPVVPLSVDTPVLAAPAVVPAAVATLEAVRAESPAPGAAAAPGLSSFFRHTLDALLVPASLSALAAIAVPGLAGLLIIAAAGIRLGYRQAKAALTVRTSRIARFDRSGPIGIVRASALVAVHGRGPRAHAPVPAALPNRLLEQVA